MSDGPGASVEDGAHEDEAETKEAPAAQLRHAAAAPRLYVFAAQLVHAALEVWPVAGENVPAAQGAGGAPEPGQNQPAGHVAVLAAAPPAQKTPAAHAAGAAPPPAQKKPGAHCAHVPVPENDAV